MLTVTIKDAVLTNDVDVVGKQDPFVELKLKAQGWSWKSKVVQEGGKTPAWNETVSIDVNSLQDKLVLKVWDSDLDGCSKELIGK